MGEIFKCYLMLVASVILLALNFIVQKFFQKQTGGSPREAIKFSAYRGAVTAVCFTVFCLIMGYEIRFSWFSAAMAVGISLLCMAYNTVGFAIMKTEPVSRYTVFLMIGGMAVPYLWGLFFLNEEFSFLRTIGLVVLAVAIVLTNSGKSKINKKALILCIIVFVLNGFVSVLSKEHQIGQLAVDATSFVIINGIVKVIMFPLAYLFPGEPKTGNEEKVEKKPLLTKDNLKEGLLIALSAVLDGVSYLLMLIPAEILPATVQYPFVTGGSIILTALAGLFFFREKPKPLYIVGLLLCLAGTCLFL